LPAIIPAGFFASDIEMLQPFRAVADRPFFPLLSLFLKSVSVAGSFFPLYLRMIAAWPMVSVSQPSQKPAK
jgi:hypothetical protein